MLLSTFLIVMLLSVVITVILFITVVIPWLNYWEWRGDVAARIRNITRKQRITGRKTI
jgi:hypothetical protein